MSDPALTPEVLEELRRLDHEATPGPWGADTEGVFCLHPDGIGGTVAVPGDPYPRGVNAPVESMQLIALMRTHLPALLAAAQRVQELEADLRAHRAELEAIDDALGPLTEATRQAQVRGLVEELRAVYQLAGSPRTVFMGEPFLRVEVTWQAGWGRSLQEAARYYAGIGAARQAEKETTT